MSAKAANAETKTGFFAKVKRYFRDMKGELKKVVWPDKKQVTNNTSIVLVTLVIAAAIIGGVDFVLSQLVSLFFIAA